jgi:hypothetical protein
VFDDPVLAPLVLERDLPVSTAEELLRVSDADGRRDLATRAAELDWTVGEARKAISEIGANRTNVADLMAHLRQIVSMTARITPESLSPSERKTIRQARAALGRLLRAGDGQRAVSV